MSAHKNHLIEMFDGLLEPADTDHEPDPRISLVREALEDDDLDEAKRLLATIGNREVSITEIKVSVERPGVARTAG